MGAVTAVIFIGQPHPNRAGSRAFSQIRREEGESSAPILRWAGRSGIAQVGQGDLGRRAFAPTVGGETHQLLHRIHLAPCCREDHGHMGASPQYAPKPRCPAEQLGIFAFRMQYAIEVEEQNHRRVGSFHAGISFNGTSQFEIPSGSL